MEQKTRVFSQIDVQEFRLWPMPPLPPFLMYYWRNKCPTSLYHLFLAVIGAVLFAPTLSLSVPFKQCVDKKSTIPLHILCHQSLICFIFFRPFFLQSSTFPVSTPHSVSSSAGLASFFARIFLSANPTPQGCLPVVSIYPFSIRKLVLTEFFFLGIAA
jgi:hypothetical protein